MNITQVHCVVLVTMAWLAWGWAQVGNGSCKNLGHACTAYHNVLVRCSAARVQPIVYRVSHHM